MTAGHETMHEDASMRAEGDTSSTPGAHIDDAAQNSDRDHAARIHEATLRLLALPDLDVFVGADWVVPFDPRRGTRPVLVVRDASGEDADRIDLDQVETVLALYLGHGPEGVRAWTGIRRGRPLAVGADRHGPEALARKAILGTIDPPEGASAAPATVPPPGSVHLEIPDDLALEVFALQHDPADEARWTVRLPTRGGLDMLPLNNGFAATNDAVGTGTSLTEALVQARREQDRRRT